MHGSRESLAILSTLLLVVAAGCGSAAPSTSPGTPSGQAATASPSPTLAPSTGPSASASLTETFPYGSFDRPTEITNQWLPYVPGTRWVLDGVTVADEEAITHQIILTITDLTKVVDGVESVVAYDEDWSDGVLVEAEIFFMAQDNDGNVWRMGEYPEEYEDGIFVEAPGWLAGQEGALAGYAMFADPQPWSRSYAQGWGPAVGWADRAHVAQVGVRDCVPAACYDSVLVVEEWNLDEPDARQLKYYAPGIGNVRVGWSGSADQDQEDLQLLEVRQLSPAELAEVRAKARALEAHAYEVLADLYGTTAPMEPHA